MTGATDGTTSTSPQRVAAAGLAVARPLHDFVEHEALPGTGVSGERFWRGAAEIIREFGARNRALLVRREELQSQIDAYHRRAPGPVNPKEYTAFLREIGYIGDDVDPFTVTTAGVDTEISAQPGPQLVAPLINRRLAANAVNARWGSLYDALYGTDAIPRDGDLAPGPDYNQVRGRPSSLRRAPLSTSSYHSP